MTLRHKLTKREVEILQLLTNGMNYTDIAARLVISLKTLLKHTNSIFRKLDVSSQTQAVIEGLLLDLVALPNNRSGYSLSKRRSATTKENTQ